MSVSPPAATATPLLDMRGIDKAFPGVKALRGVDLELRRGEVLAILGENGAGKSTLIKVLSGAHLPDAGMIRLEGRRLQIAGPLDAQRAGVQVIYQEFNLVPALSARENIFLGRERLSAGFLSPRYERRRAEALFRRLGLAVDCEWPCRRLTVAQQQLVEIAKALSANASIIVMDEPTAALSAQEVGRLFEIIMELKSLGIGIIYISHRLDEIFEIADRVTVLRDGVHVATHDVRSVTRQTLIEQMVGRRLDNEFPKKRADIGGPLLSVRGLRGGRVRDVSFIVRRGEVLGLTGLVGAGRTETARLIFAADRREGGTIEIDGKPVRVRSPRDAIRHGICLLTEDRKAEGLVEQHSLRENFGLPNLSHLSRLGFVEKRRERHALAGYVRGLRIKATSSEQPVKNLSGGNQQKVILAKWLEANCRVLFFDEPTRGIDVGAKYEIYLLMNQLAAQGKAIIMISSELPEVLGMSDRILVMHDGRISGEIQEVGTATQEQILKLAIT